MSRSITASHDSIVFDACTLLNLYASDRIGDIINAFNEQAMVTDYVKDRETLKRFDGPDNDPRSLESDLDLDPFIDSGHLALASLDDAETDLYVDLVFDMVDDGEAMTAAVAINRRFGMATDDLRAQNVMARRAPHITLVDTPVLVRHWADARRIPDLELNRTVWNIRNRAIYTAPKRHPLRDWWMQHESGPR